MHESVTGKNSSSSSTEIKDQLTFTDFSLNFLFDFTLMFFMSHLYLVTLTTRNSQLRLEKGFDKRCS